MIKRIKTFSPQQELPFKAIKFFLWEKKIPKIANFLLRAHFVIIKFFSFQVFSFGLKTLKYDVGIQYSNMVIYSGLNFVLKMYFEIRKLK